jgi:signal transduction histidine kinase
MLPKLIKPKFLMSRVTRLWRTASQVSQSVHQFKLNQLKSCVPSADYRAWRHQFLLQRLQLGLAIAIPSYILIIIHTVYETWFVPHPEITDLRLAVEQTHTSITCSVILSLLLLSWGALRSQWGQRYPTVILVLLAWSLNDFIDQVIGLFFRSPNPPDPLVILAIALLIPVHWRLHLLAQVPPIVMYLAIYPLLNMTEIGSYMIYDVRGIRVIIDLFWVCLTSVLAVYWYERLKQSEFEVQRQLQVFLYSVSHDLQTPAMGTSMLLKSVLNDPSENITLHRSILEGLQEGSDRQSVLIESLLDAHRTDLQVTQLNCQPFQLSSFIESLLLSLQPLLNQHEVQLFNRIDPNLPLVNGDPNQLWRVFSNLITNSLKHNPNRIKLTLDAKVIYPENILCCTVQDNGIGIPPQQSQQIFERYMRGSRARYMPGLGLGLYICRMIVQAHGGEITVESQPGTGTTFRFTLPLA